MKLKENKGMSLIVLTIILVVLVVLAGGVIVYLLKNQETISQNAIGNNPTVNNISNEAYENKNQVDEKNEVEENKSENYYDEKVIGTIDNITIKRTFINKDGENYLTYTKKNKNNKIIWTYKTETDKKYKGPAFDFAVDHIDITDNRVYINELGKIVALNKENGKVIWEKLIADGVIIESHCLDKEQNLYMSYDSKVNIIDKNGKLKAEISHPAVAEIHGEGGAPDYKFINEDELLICCINHYIGIDLKDFDIEYVIKKEFTKDNVCILKKVDKNENGIWISELPKTGSDYYLFNNVEQSLNFKSNETTVSINVDTGILLKNTDSEGKEDNTTEKSYIKIFNVGDDFNRLSDVGKLVWDAEKNTKIEYDLNNDGVKEKISVKYDADNTNIIVINDKKLKIEYLEGNIDKLYVVDLNINDKTTELIGVADGNNGFERKIICTYVENELKLIKTFEAIGDNFFINNNGKIVNYPNTYANIILTKKYYTYKNGNLSESNVNLDNISTQVFIIEKSDYTYYTYDKNVQKVCQEAMNSNYNLEACGIYTFKENTKVEIIDFNTGFGNDIIEAKLQNGKTIYIFGNLGYLAG